MALTPEEFGRRLLQVRTSVANRQRVALEARVKIAQAAVIAGGQALGGLGRKVGPESVATKYMGSRAEPVAYLRLKGGFSVLEERGSYKKPGGYEIDPRALSSRRRGRLRRQQGLLHRAAGPVDVSGGGVNVSGILGRPGRFGPVTGGVHHPPERPHPFFRASIEGSNRAGIAAYRRVIEASIAEAIR